MLSFFKILKNKKNTTIFVSFIVPIFVTILLFTGFLHTWEYKISDAFYNSGNVSEEIVIIAIDDESLQELGRWPWPRSYFASVLNKLNNSNVIGFDVSFFEPAENDEEFASVISNHNVVLAMEYTNFSFIDDKLYGKDFLKPSDTLGLAGVDYSIGYVNLYTGSDGVTRTFSPAIKGEKQYYHFSMMIVKKITGILPPVEQSKMLIHYFSEPGGYKTISFSDVYNGNINNSLFRNKIILIGATAPDLHDDAIVPISNQVMSGVEINANLVQSLLFRDYIYYQDFFSTVLLIFIFAFLVSLFLYRFRIHIATTLTAFTGFIFIVFSIQLFDMGIIMNIIFPLFSMIAVYVVLLIYYYITEEKSRKWITQVFGKYVSPMVIENLIRNPDLINLGGEKRNITIFFSDIRGFTAISEKLKPEELVHLLNEYLTAMTSIIIKDEGLVDKYMGDAIMAFWGAPMKQVDHAIKACESSLEMLGTLKELQKQWKQRKIPSFNIGMGLNSGEAIVGNMGSEKRFDYTAMGDNVNLASRLEGLNKIYETNIIISDQTYQLVKDIFYCRKLDAVKVKGKKTALYIYELIGKKNEVNKEIIDFILQYEQALDLYFKQQFKEAIEGFQKAQKIKKDPSSELMISRCTAFIDNPPDKDWNGIWEMKMK